MHACIHARLILRDNGERHPYIRSPVQQHITPPVMTHEICLPRRELLSRGLAWCETSLPCTQGRINQALLALKCQAHRDLRLLERGPPANFLIFLRTNRPPCNQKYQVPHQIAFLNPALHAPKCQFTGSVVRFCERL
jgi:hypothetical protein